MKYNTNPAVIAPIVLANISNTSAFLVVVKNPCSISIIIPNNIENKITLRISDLTE